jgi:hypothetical protein
MFAVMALKTEIELEVMGITRKLDMCFADGMIGAIPVFDTIENAEKWADGLQIVQLAEGKQ